QFDRRLGGIAGHVPAEQPVIFAGIRNLHAIPLSGIVYCNCDAREMVMSSAKPRTIPPLRVSEELRADAESVLAPGETLSAFVMDAVSRTIDFRKSQLDFLAR